MDQGKKLVYYDKKPVIWLMSIFNLTYPKTDPQD